VCGPFDSDAGMVIRVEKLPELLVVTVPSDSTCEWMVRLSATPAGKPLPESVTLDPGTTLKIDTDSVHTWVDVVGADGGVDDGGVDDGGVDDGGVDDGGVVDGGVVDGVVGDGGVDDGGVDDGGVDDGGVDDGGVDDGGVDDGAPNASADPRNATSTVTRPTIAASRRTGLAVGNLDMRRLPELDIPSAFK
jgi:hypothetical protein